jgi:hypothetical protein
MKLNLVLWLITSVAATAATPEQPNPRIAVQPGGKLILDVDSGAIVVTTNGTGKVAVDVWRREHSVSFAQEGGTVTVRSPLGDRPGGPSQEQPQSEAIYTISVPAQFDAQLNNASNDDITVSNITGAVKVTSNGGGFQFAHLRGRLDGETAGGGIQVRHCEGDLRLQSSGGAVSVTGGGGSLKAETSGVIHVEGFHGYVQVESGGSVMKLEKVIGKIEAATAHGPILAVLPSPLPDDVRLSSSGGDVTVSIPESAAFTLDADTSGGVLKSDFTLVGSKKERDHVKGTVNGGGKSVVLRTGGGSIHIKKL